MFSQFEEEPQTTHNIKKNRYKRKKKNNHHQTNIHKKLHNKCKSKFSQHMGSWAENFTLAATWQLKHQLAYWKARATSLEYENRILHEIIRKNHITLPDSSENFIGSEYETEVIAQNVTQTSGIPSHNEENVRENDDFEVSEEFIEFLKENAKHKEDAKREREKLKAKELLEENKRLEEQVGPSLTAEEREEILKGLYGDKWMEIGALELSIQSDFIDKCDKSKPVYWPNIPLNFKFS